ncbi:MAG: ABC transporter permease [Defluviitaleaceae bacterium]|nr:ABC transporter permease [Defluviitaleaceae bacterium]
MSGFLSGFKAIFKKQIKDTLRNPASLMQFIIFPLIAFVITLLMDFEAQAESMAALIPYDVDIYAIAADMVANMPNLTTMQATIFAGMGLIPVVSGIIVEDVERKSLRFLKMAGLKPSSYLLGIGGVILFYSFFSSVAFSLIGEFRGLDFWVFLASMMSGVAASIVLGATFGVMSTNAQASAGVAMPVAMILGFGPLVAQFNDSVARGLHFTFTQQLNVVADYLNTGISDTSLWESFAIIWANVAVLSVLFAIVYTKKGLKD